MKSSKTGLKNGGESPPRSMSESGNLVAAPSQRCVRFQNATQAQWAAQRWPRVREKGAHDEPGQESRAR